jgi:Ca2+:H+ antiporter
VAFPQLLGEATEQVALDLGETLGALLNASLGNLVELILGIAGK